MEQIENGFILANINPLGAELTRFFSKHTSEEFLWNGDPKFWGKHSPVLFPIIGTLKNNQYIFNDKTYQLGRHGFAREKMFTVIERSASAVIFQLQQDESTMAVFPFPFSFEIEYTLEEGTLQVTYRVKNTGNTTMYFSVGGHPAFNLALTSGLAYEDYYLLFNKTEDAGRWPISADGLIEAAPLPLLQNTNRLPLTKSLFYKDAIVLKNLASNEVQVRSDKTPTGMIFSFKGFPYLGIWAAKDADFICIEPWCGIADSINTSQQLTEKEGIISLPAGEDFTRSWSVTIL